MLVATSCIWKWMFALRWHLYSRVFSTADWLLHSIRTGKKDVQPFMVQVWLVTSQQRSLRFYFLVSHLATASMFRKSAIYGVHFRLATKSWSKYPALPTATDAWSIHEGSCGYGPISPGEWLVFYLAVKISPPCKDFSHLSPELPQLTGSYLVQMSRLGGM